MPWFPPSELWTEASSESRGRRGGAQVGLGPTKLCSCGVQQSGVLFGSTVACWIYFNFLKMFLHVWAFCVHTEYVYMCAMCTVPAEAVRGVGYPELESWAVVSPVWVLRRASWCANR